MAIILAQIVGFVRRKEQTWPGADDLLSQLVLYAATPYQSLTVRESWQKVLNAMQDSNLWFCATEWDTVIDYNELHNTLPADDLNAAANIWIAILMRIKTLKNRYNANTANDLERYIETNIHSIRDILAAEKEKWNT